MVNLQKYAVDFLIRRSAAKGHILGACGVCRFVVEAVLVNRRHMPDTELVTISPNVCRLRYLKALSSPIAKVAVACKGRKSERRGVGTVNG